MAVAIRQASELLLGLQPGQWSDLAFLGWSDTNWWRAISGDFVHYIFDDFW
jgi:hypothetical protein